MEEIRLKMQCREDAIKLKVVMVEDVAGVKTQNEDEKEKEYEKALRNDGYMEK